MILLPPELQLQQQVNPLRLTTMFRRSLHLLKHCFTKSKQAPIQPVQPNDPKLSDSYQLTQSQISQILNRPQPSQPSPLSPTTTQQLIYDLPLKNKPYPLVYDQQDLRQIAQTPTQNLFQILNIHKQSTLNEYLTGIQTKYHNEIDLYGDAQPPIQKQKLINLQTIEFKDLITTNSPYLLFLRKKYLVNPNIPGTIQLEDANNFLDLRPVEDFRHTPLIPISETAMKKFKEEMEERHNRAFFFSVKTETMINIGMFIGSLIVIGTLIGEVRKGSDKKVLEVMRTKHQRLMGEY